MHHSTVRPEADVARVVALHDRESLLCGVACGRGCAHDTFAAQQKQKAAEELAAANGVVKQTRKPRFRTQLRHEMRDRIAARQAARQAHDGAGQEHPPPPTPTAPPQLRAAHDPPPPQPGD